MRRIRRDATRDGVVTLLAAAKASRAIIVQILDATERAVKAPTVDRILRFDTELHLLEDECRDWLDDHDGPTG